jgi:hypothetical protein
MTATQALQAYIELATAVFQQTRNSILPGPRFDAEKLVDGLRPVLQKFKCNERDPFLISEDDNCKT